ncbi:MAG: CdaR family protein [Deltaproteobacteria bacterium]|nr:CdaR family protein [Deltaproteobacteria bacterium]
MRGKIYTFTASVALAFCLWLSLAGQDATVVDFTVPLYLHSLPGHLLIKGEVPKVVTLRLWANAAQMRFLSDQKVSLSLDLSRAQEGHNTFPVLLAPLNLPRGVEVSEVNPGVIEFDALLQSSKRLPVTPVVIGLPASGYRLDSLILEPAVVTVQGPVEVLAQMDHLETTPLDVDGLTQDAVFTVGAALPAEGGVFMVEAMEIQATVKVSEILTQAVFSDIPVQIEARKGEPASFIAQPARVSVTVSWASSRKQPIKAGDIRAQVSVDVEQLKTEGHITLPVVVVPPAGATVMTINPVTVSVSYVPSALPGERRKP